MTEMNNENEPVQETVEMIGQMDTDQIESGIPGETVAEQDPLLEISVLDYLKFKLNPKNFGKEILPADLPVDEAPDDAAVTACKELGKALA